MNAVMHGFDCSRCKEAAIDKVGVHYFYRPMEWEDTDRDGRKSYPENCL